MAAWWLLVCHIGAGFLGVAQAQPPQDSLLILAECVFNPWERRDVVANEIQTNSSI